jgi:uncharacterized glyoxalase superfamily protein PhnB
MTGNVRPIPSEFHSITPGIVLKDARKAIEFYERAFGAQSRYTFEDGQGRVMHAEIKIGDSVLMMCDEMPEMKCFSPETLKGATSSLYLYVEDVDAAFDRAVKAGAQVKMPVADMFWGDRAGTVVDPFGYQWMIATHTQELTPEQIHERGRQFLTEMAGARSK